MTKTKKVWKGPRKMRSFLVALETLDFDPENPRDHSEGRSVDALVNGLEDEGQVQVMIVSESGMVADGNGRLEAMRRLGWTHAAVLPVGDDDAARRIALRLNRSAELAGWNYERVSGLLHQLQDQEFDLTRFGYADFDLGPLLNATWTPPDPTGDLGDFTRDPNLIALDFTPAQVKIIEAAMKEEGTETRVETIMKRFE